MAPPIDSGLRVSNGSIHQPVQGPQSADVQALGPGLPQTAPAGSAPASATPVSDLKAHTPEADASAVQQELEHLDAQPQKQGFFSGLVSGLKSFMKNHASTLLAVGTLAAVVVFTGGAAAVGPLLWGLAAGGATIGACSALMPKDAADKSDDDEELSETQADTAAEQAQSQAQALEQQRRAQALLEQEAISADLLGIGEQPAAQSLDLLDLGAGEQGVSSMGAGTNAGHPAVMAELKDVFSSDAEAVQSAAHAPPPAAPEPPADPPAASVASKPITMEELGQQIQDEIRRSQRM